MSPCVSTSCHFLKGFTSSFLEAGCFASFLSRKRQRGCQTLTVRIRRPLLALSASFRHWQTLTKNALRLLHSIRVRSVQARAGDVGKQYGESMWLHQASRELAAFQLWQVALPLRYSGSVKIDQKFSNMLWRCRCHLQIESATIRVSNHLQRTLSPRHRTKPHTSIDGSGNSSENQLISLL